MIAPILPSADLANTFALIALITDPVAAKSYLEQIAGRMAEAEKALADTQALEAEAARKLKHAGELANQAASDAAQARADRNTITSNQADLAQREKQLRDEIMLHKSAVAQFEQVSAASRGEIEQRETRVLEREQAAEAQNKTLSELAARLEQKLALINRAVAA